MIYSLDSDGGVQKKIMKVLKEKIELSNLGNLTWGLLTTLLLDWYKKFIDVSTRFWLRFWLKTYEVNMVHDFRVYINLDKDTYGLTKI